MRLARETWLLLVIGLLDLASTVWFVCLGIAWEANPVMYWYLERGGMWVFCLVKVILVIFPLAILEWVRRVEPYLGQWALRLALLGYLLLYPTLVWRANGEYILNLFASRIPSVSYCWQGVEQKSPLAPQTRLPMAMPLEKDGLSMPY